MKDVNLGEYEIKLNPGFKKGEIEVSGYAQENFRHKIQSEELAQ